MVWDGPGRSWRYDLYPEYKAARQSKDKSDVAFIFKQMPTLKTITAMLGIPSVEVPAVEADDLIGILAMWTLQNNHGPIIYSSDKDFIRFVQYSIGVIRDVDKKYPLRLETAESVQVSFGCGVKDVL